jgi:asparagine synthase (glutamine-hydrolysing)
MVRHAEAPVVRTAPVPMMLLADSVRAAGYKVVLTGEGADEMFAGYDLFREGKVRRFWGRVPASAIRPRLLERLYPYLARSPVAQQATARKFFGQDLGDASSPGFAHQVRWRSTAAVQRLFSRELQATLAGADVTVRLLDSLPADFPAWTPLAQDQYLEIRTLLSGYLLSSQGDRMLMAHSVEGRFPFLDTAVVDLADSLPDRAKLRGLDEKHILKRVAKGLVPEEIIRRSKQPYRAPDAASFVGPGRPDWIDELMSEQAVRDAGIFDPQAVERLWRKCRDAPSGTRFSNVDNMALVGVLSSGLLHERLVRASPGARMLPDRADLDVRVDLVDGPAERRPELAATMERQR